MRSIVLFLITTAAQASIHTGTSGWFHITGSFGGGQCGQCSAYAWGQEVTGNVGDCYFDATITSPAGCLCEGSGNSDGLQPGCWCQGTVNYIRGSYGNPADCDVFNMPQWL